LDDPRFKSQQGKRFSLHQNIQTGSGAYPATYAVGTKFFFPVPKPPRHELYHSLPPSAEVKNEWSYTSPSPIYIFIAWTKKYSIPNFSFFLF
jgi:hypothetical protein